MSLNSRGNLSWNDDFATGWSRSNFYAIFSVNRYANCVWLLHKYEAHMKGLPICFSEVQVKNDVTDNNNKHFVTAFEGECRNIIELREHLKLCFLIILARAVSTYGIGCQQCHFQWKYILRPVKPCPHFRQHFCLFVSLSRSLDNLARNEHDFLL